MFRKITLGLLGIALAGAVAVPVFAKEGKIKNEPRGVAGLFRNIEAEDDNGVGEILAGGIMGNSSIRAAQKTYKEAVKQAETAYRNAVKTARTNLITKLNEAKNDQSKRISAYKAYLTELLAASKQRSAAKENALQQLIDAISAIPANAAPTANSQTVAVSKNTSKAITLTGSDPENSSLSFIVVTNPSHGVLSGLAPALTYLPNTDYVGTDSFTFKVNDGSLNSAVATISITVSQ